MKGGNAALALIPFVVIFVGILMIVLWQTGVFGGKSKEKMTGTTCPPMLTPAFSSGTYYSGVVTMLVEVSVDDSCSPPTSSNVNYMYEAQSGSMNLLNENISTKFIGKNPDTTTSTYLITITASSPEYNPSNPSWQYGTLTLGWTGVPGSATKPINVQWQ